MKLTKKGMTLFELLAVIVILGIVAAIAFPTVNGLITNAKKDTFVSNVNMFIDAARTDAQDKNLNGQGLVIEYDVENGEVTVFDANGTTVAKAAEAYSLGFTKDLELTSGKVRFTFTDVGTVPTTTITTAFVGEFTTSTTYPVTRENLSK